MIERNFPLLSVDVHTTTTTSSNKKGIALAPSSPKSSQGDQDVLVLLRDIDLGFEQGRDPIPIDECTGGAYFLRSSKGRIVAVFKPQDEEPYAANNPKAYSPPHDDDDDDDDDDPQHNHKGGIKCGIPAGKAAIREVAAYLLDRALVPRTILAQAHHPRFHHHHHHHQDEKKKMMIEAKFGSLQEYMHHDCTSEDFSATRFSCESVQAIAMLDLRLVNQDRHAGNILIERDSHPTLRKRPWKSVSDLGDMDYPRETYQHEPPPLVLIPIDHGCTLPHYNQMTETNFVWMNWPQSKAPLYPEHLETILHLNSWQDAEMLRQELQDQLVPEAVLTLHIGTSVLQTCAKRGWSLCAMGELFCRRSSSTNTPSEIERLICETQREVLGHDDDDSCCPELLLFMTCFGRKLQEFLDSSMIPSIV